MKRGDQTTKIPPMAAVRAKKGECIDLLDSDDEILLPPMKKAKAASTKSASKPSIKASSPKAAAPKAESVSIGRPPPFKAVLDGAVSGEKATTTCTVANSTSSSSSLDPSLRADGYPIWMDLIDTTGKPARYSKRMMGETKKLFSEEGRKSQQEDGIIFSTSPNPLYETQMFDMAKWEVVLRTDKVNKDSKLAESLKQHNLEGIYFEMQIPNEYPMLPPFVRIKHPKLSGGYVFEHGAICFEPLTPKGWPIAMTLSSLMIAIKGIFDYNPVFVSSVGDVKNKTIPGYTEEGARRDYKTVLMAHEGGKSWNALNSMSS